MNSLNDFIKIANLVIDPTGRNVLNQQQRRAIKHPLDRVLQVVAGPGSGKTTVLVLRALRLVFVDNILPEHILIVTFTRKAASELRSRWLRDGEAIKVAIGGFNHVDLNRCQIGTLDSIAQQALTDHRLPGQTAPMVMDNVAGQSALRRFAFSEKYQHNKATINQILRRYTFQGDEPRNQSEALETMQSLLQRLIQDKVDVTSYRAAGVSEALILDILQVYQQKCEERNAYDFTGMERLFLERLTQGQLEQWSSRVRALLVDEYQDTNPLQESIYFSIIKATSAITTIVGDDDQSLYRFRGGSVELFTDFANRCQKATGCSVHRIDTVANYRSTPEIIDFYNDYIVGDPAFTPARINPPKPLVHATQISNELPVLGMFRPDEDSLAESLAEFLTTLLQSRRYQVGQQAIELPSNGDLGDIVFLSYSVKEQQYDWRNKSNRELFPRLLRNKLVTADLEVFNPRGQSLRNVLDVQKLLGLLLLTVDPDRKTSGEMFLRNEAKFFLDQWREAAEVLIATNPVPTDRCGLEGFVKRWQAAASGQCMENETWREWPVLEVVYRLLTWLPVFHNEPEHQAWLHAILGNIDSVTAISPYGMKLHSITKNNQATDHVIRSRQAFIRDALVPIAEDSVYIDEDILLSVPRNMLQIMTIHQAKGLEFPMVIVDVGSKFKRNHHKQKFLRFPDKPSSVVLQEDDMEPHLAAPLRGKRGQIHRTFDDLTRLYYVAYSRPQSVLLLVANEKCLGVKNGIPNIALGWRRDQTWPWWTLVNSKTPIKANNIPLYEV